MKSYCTLLFFFPGLDGLPLPTTPSTGCYVLNSWNIPATEQITRGRQSQGDRLSRPDQHLMELNAELMINDPAST